MYDKAAVAGDLDVIAVGPDVRESFKIGSVVAAGVIVVPEPDRHRRKRLCAHQLPFLA